MDSILNTIFTLAAFIFVLGVMIFIHEFGHFMAAKWLKIRVEIFSLGFGTRLWGFQRGETDYRVCLLPLGGFVKLAGENPDEEISGNADEFLSRPKYQRFLVYVTGPLMNILLAILFTAANFMVGVETPRYLKETPKIGLTPPDSPAAKAGLLSGDVILSVDGKKMDTWQDLRIAVGSNPNRELEFLVRRGEQEIPFKITTIAQGKGDIGSVGFVPYLPQPVVERVEAGYPAEKIGLRKGDVILQLRNEQQVAEDQYAMYSMIYGNEGKELQIAWKRGEQTFTGTVVPAKLDLPGSSPYPGQGRLGVGFSMPSVVERYGPLASLRESVRRNYEITVLTFDLLAKLFRGQASIKVMSGPIDIAVYSGEAARVGGMALIGFMALISLQLGIFNLLPVPVLDGGQIFLLFLEGLLRRDLSLKVKENINKVGFVLLILLMSVVIFNDISKHTSSWWDKLFP